MTTSSIFGSIFFQTRGYNGEYEMARREEKLTALSQGFSLCDFRKTTELVCRYQGKLLLVAEIDEFLLDATEFRVSCIRGH